MNEPFPCIRQGYQYYISFLEGSKSFIDIEPPKFKNDAVAAFKNYKALCKKESGSHLKIFHTDGGGEYMEAFDDFLKENGRSHEVNISYPLEQNGEAEGVNRTILGFLSYPCSTKPF